MLKLNSVQASFLAFSVLAVSVFSFVAFSLPAQAAGLKVSPVLECVISRDLDSDGVTDLYTGVFGYFNRNAEVVSVAAGSNDNKFNPTPALRSQPTDFQPGRVVGAFAVNFVSGNQVWTLKSLGNSAGTATVNPTSKPCTAGQEALHPYNPAFTF